MFNIGDFGVDFDRALQVELDTLDEYQIKLVQESFAPIKAYANAGSGKTKVLVARALKMVIRDGIVPDSIVMNTFTNKAAKEIKERYLMFFEKIIGSENTGCLSSPLISTIHSYGASLIRNGMGRYFTIMSEYPAIKEIQKSMEKVLTQWERVLVKDAIKVKDQIQALVSDMRLHHIVCPILPRNLRFQNVLLEDTRNLSESGQKVFDYLERFTRRTYASKMLQDVGGSVGSIEGYAQDSGLDPKDFRSIVISYYTEKYRAFKFDFSDLIVFPILACASETMQFQENFIWGKYKHFLQDEAQDMDTSQFSLLLLSDRDSYLNYTKDLRV